MKNIFFDFEPKSLDIFGLLRKEDDISYCVLGFGTATATDIVIADEYEGLPVTRIVDGYEYRPERVMSMIIPDSVMSIGGSVFSHCESLTSITDQGTTDEWNAIAKERKWNADTPAYTIHCTDGDIIKNNPPASHSLI